MDSFYRPTWVEVSLDALRHNIESFRRALPEGMRVMAVVKADAYGHGAVAVAKEAVDCGASYVGVAFLDEAIELRRAGFEAPILVLGYTPPDGVPLAIRYGITLTVFSDDLWEALDRVRESGGPLLKVHVKLDTGMGRLGLHREDDAIAYIERALRHPALIVEGLCTHFSCADMPDKSYTFEQHRKFDRIVKHFAEKGITFPYVHAGNSAAALDCPELSYNMVRLGIGMYGLYPSEHVRREKVALQPVMSFKTKPVLVKTLPPGSAISYGATYRTRGEETIATLPVGYADGYSRMLSNRVQVLVRGREVPVVGNICMDQCMANVTGLDVTADDEFVLLGRQGDAVITAEQLANLLGTIPYEITCMISHRVPRVYIRNGRMVDVVNPLFRQPDREQPSVAGETFSSGNR